MQPEERSMKLQKIIFAFVVCIFVLSNYSVGNPAQESAASADITIKVSAAEQIKSIFQSALGSADLGIISEQYFVGELYHSGVGVKQDNVQAYKWLYLCASAKGEPAEKAARLRDAVGKEMTPDQLAQARQLATEWKTAHLPRFPRAGDSSSWCGTGNPDNGPCMIEGDVKAPVPLIQPLPIYTSAAFQAGIEGTMFLQIIVRKDGTADSIKVIRGLGYGLDESAAYTVAKRWRFQPGILDGNPVDVIMNISVSFTLEQQPCADQ
jgi:TonB family protein